MATLEWGFDKKDIDTKVRPQDDFFTWATGNWMKRNTIPKDEAYWGPFQMLHKKSQQQIKAILSDLLRSKKAKKGSPEQLIGDFYRSGMDMGRRNALGAKPLAAFLRDIDSLKSARDVVQLITKFHALGIGDPWGTMVGQDDKRSDVNVMHLYQSGLGMPDRDYYLGDGQELERVRSAYLAHLERVFKLLGENEARAKENARNVLKLETKLAHASMRKEDLRDPDMYYNKMTIAQLRKIAPAVPRPKYFAALGATSLRELTVMQPKFIKAVNELLENESVDTWKIYLRAHTAEAAAPYLSDAFVRESFSFYVTTLTGQKVMKPLWRRVLAVVDGSLGEELGKIYVQRHFPPETKRAIDALVTNVFSAYRERMKNLDWMSPATKKKALKKLSMMDRKIGYPKKWKSYKGLQIAPGDYFGNVLRSVKYERRRNIKKLKKPVDRTEWHMTPQTVNAYYNPGTNEIVFPAAILQPPYFGASQDAGINYGAIGGVIGHEITHGFDNMGSKYDGKGNLRAWWSAADRKKFDKKAKVLINQFNEYKLHGEYVNGELTLPENIADLGGYAIAYDAYTEHLSKSKSRTIDGFTPLERFFLGMAGDWKQLARPESEKTLMLTNEHSPHVFRVNGPASNMEAFYETWGVKKGDKLYRTPKKRAKIW